MPENSHMMLLFLRPTEQASKGFREVEGTLDVQARAADSGVEYFQ
jgi:hypothetical protein